LVTHYVFQHFKTARSLPAHWNTAKSAVHPETHGINDMRAVLLIINTGSSSIKFAVFSARQLTCLYRGQIQGIGIPKGSYFSVQDLNDDGNSQPKQKTVANNHRQALATLMQWLTDHLASFHLQAVGHRIVHGGHQFTRPVVINSDVMQQLRKLIPLAPLHQPHNLAAIDILQQLYPDLIQVACFDTAFHHTQPEVAQTFALPKDLFTEGVRSYGFHGLSYEYIANTLPDYAGCADTGKTIIAHLGQGASLCALHNRQSMATTMTFTPLDGLPMGTRCGAIDPAIVLYLLRQKRLSLIEVSDMLHYQSGLLGLSGISGDMQVLLNSNHPDAAFAIDAYVYRIIRAIGSMTAAIQGLDNLVFSAGIGEHAPLIRAKICQGLGWLGVELDDNANRQNATKISCEHSAVNVWVIPTNEEKMIAIHTNSLTHGKNQ